MKIIEKREHPLGDVYLFQSKSGLQLEAYFSGDYTQHQDELRAVRYGKLGKIPIEEKAIVKLSVMAGCPYKCKPCDAGNAGFFGVAEVEDIINQFNYVVQDQNLTSCKKLKLHISKLGEPALNWSNSFMSIKEIIKNNPQFSIIPTVSTLPRDKDKLDIMSSDLFTFAHPIKQLKINLGASNERRRRELLGKCLTLAEIHQRFEHHWDSCKNTQRITLTLLAIDGENVDTNYILNSIPNNRDKYTIELYKVNQTVSAQNNQLGNNLQTYKEAEYFQKSMDDLTANGFFTYYSAPSNGEQKALVANGSSLLQYHYS